MRPVADVLSRPRLGVMWCLLTGVIPKVCSSRLGSLTAGYGILTGMASLSVQRRNGTGTNQYQAKAAARPPAPSARLLNQASSAVRANPRAAAPAERHLCATGRHKYHLTEGAAASCAGGPAQYAALSNWQHIIPAPRRAAHGGPGPAVHGRQPQRPAAHGGPGPAVHGRQAADNPSSPPDILRALSRDPDVSVRCRVAGNPSSPPDILRALSRDPDVSVRCRVAGNPSSPPDILRELSQDPDADVRRYAARNESSQPGTLGRLSRDPDFFVRLGVAANISSPQKVLQRLLRDKYLDVQLAAAANPSLPRATLAMYQLTKVSDKERSQPQYQVVHGGGHGR